MNINTHTPQGEKRILSGLCRDKNETSGSIYTPSVHHTESIVLSHRGIVKQKSPIWEENTMLASSANIVYNKKEARRCFYGKALF
jgi:hypothetical protein